MVVLNMKDTPVNNNRGYIFILLLTFLTFSSLTLSIISVKDLKWEDRLPMETGAMLFVYGLIFFTASYETSNRLFFHTNTGQKFVKKYSLSKGFVMEISNKNISTIQALFCCITGLTSTCYSCTRDMLKTSHYISEAYAWFGAAYFFYDIWSMYDVQKAVIMDERFAEKTNGSTKNGIKNVPDVDDEDGKRNFGMALLYFVKTHAVIVGHHVFVGGFGFLVMTYLRGGLGDCFFGFIFLMEASTPFVSFRSIISKMGLKTSIFYIVNGILMMASFFIFRVLMWPLAILLYAYSINASYVEAINTLPRGCKISILILMLPQLYWFTLIVKGATQFGKTKKKKI